LPLGELAFTLAALLPLEHSRRARTFGLLATIAIIVVARASAVAQSTVTTDPVGFTATSCLANSDTYVGVPFTRPPEFIGTVQSVSGNVLTINGISGWSNNQFAYAASSQSKHYYLLIGSGGATNTKEGHIFPVAANGSNTLTVDTTAENLTGVTANTQIVLIPYWTPATVFPASDAGVSFTPTSSPPTYQTLLRIPNYSAPGINQPYAAEYYFNNGSWQRVSPAGVGDDDPLLPDSYFVVRNVNGAPTLPLTTLGSIMMKKVSVPLLTASNQQQDNPVTMIRPVDTTLDSNGLAPIDTSFLQGDQLLLFDNTQQQIGKQPSKTYTFDDGWRLVGDTADHSKDIVPAGSAMLVRKASTRSGQAIYWSNSAPYVAETSVMPLAAGSRKSHAGVRAFDVNVPASNDLGIECRAVPSSPGSQQIVFTFANPVTVSGATAASLTNGSVSYGPPLVAGNHVTVNLTGVSSPQRLLITLSGVSDGTVMNDITIPMGVLLGDVNATGRTDSGDQTLVRNNSVSIPGMSTFRYDVNCSGRIDSGDQTVVRSASVTALP
jgi:uncharacterized protein (TIGR02597 family)